MCIYLYLIQLFESLIGISLYILLNHISVIYGNLQLLFKLNRPFEVASRGYPFIISFSKALAQHEVSDIFLFM